MSYDVSISGGDLDANYTYNAYAMFLKAGVPIMDLHGMKGADALPRLNAAIAAMAWDRAAFEKLEPSNGWGDFDGALNFLRDIRRACEDHPEGVLDVS